VQIRTRVKNELQHLMLNQGVQKKQKLWSAEGRAALASLPLEPWTHRRRHDLLNLLSMLDGQLEDLNIAVTQVAEQYPEVTLLMSQPGVGAVTALAFALTIGDVRRFQRSRHVASYLGLIPREYSSGGKQRMGGISKQGNRLMRFLLVESANIAVRFDPVFAKNIYTAATRNISPWQRWRQRASWPYGCTGYFGRRHRIHKFSHRGQPEMYSGQRKLDREAE
jgi:transposase